VRHFQWCCVNAQILLLRLYKDAIKSDVFQFFFKLKITLSFNDDVSGKNDTSTDVDNFKK
jgi:hypothetical protein